MRIFIGLVALLLAVQATVWAQQKGAPGKDQDPVDTRLTPSHYFDNPLREMKGVQ